MSSLNTEFEVSLLSNVQGNPKTNTNIYETELAKPLDLPGEWDVALINISNPHNLTNSVKPYQFLSCEFVMTKMLMISNMRLI